MPITMPGAEPFYFPGNKIGCLLVHGFTATPQELRELGEYLNRQGYTVLGVRLFGHGTHWKDLARSRWTDWLASVEDGFHFLQEQCDQIIPVGFSTGGVLSLIQASQIQFPAVVAMSTPFDLPAIPALKILYPILRQLSVIIPTYKKGKPDWRDPEALAARIQYDRYPLRSVYEFGQCAYAMQSILSRVTSPLLLLTSSSDTFILPQDSERIAEKVGSSRVDIRSVQNSNHIITCDAERQRVFEMTAGFLDNVVS
jgi:carboxylesterase